MSYNITNLTTLENTGQIFTYANDAIGGLLFPLLMLSIFFVLIFAFYKYGFDVALMSSGFITGVLSMILSSVGQLNVLYPLGFGILAFLTVMYVSLKPK